MTEEKDYRRPPLGILPEFLWKERRIQDLHEATKRYMDAGYWPMLDWLREMRELIAWAQDREPRSFEVLSQRSITGIPDTRGDCVTIPDSGTNPERVVAAMAREPVRRFSGPGPEEVVSSPSGPGLVHPSVPSSQADEGWEEWQGLVRRVEEAGYKVERNAHEEWSVSCAGGGRDFGRGPVALINAYLWADAHRIKVERDRAYRADSA